jgi:hypothetical protein
MWYLNSVNILDLNLAITLWVTEVPIGVLVALLTHPFDSKQEHVIAMQTAPVQQPKPSLEIRIDHPFSLASTNSTYRLLEVLTGKKPQTLIAQTLTVKVLNAAIDSLGAKVWLNGDGPTYLLWSTTQKVLEPRTGRVTITEAPKFLNFVPEQQESLTVWMAWRQESKEYLVLHTDVYPTPNESLGGLDVEKLSRELGRINIDIQFIGKNYTDPNPRRFRLNVKSFDELNLTERD